MIPKVNSARIGCIFNFFIIFAQIKKYEKSI